MTTSSIDLILPLVASSAAVLVGGLVLLQTDRISMKILGPSQLVTKRRREYTYRWKNAMETVKLQLEYVLAGGQEKYNEDPEGVLKSTEYLSSDMDLDGLVAKIIDKKSESRFCILKIDKDPHDPTEEFFLFLLEDRPAVKAVVLYEVPLITFGVKLAKAFEDQLTTTTLCFVGDASSGKASSMLEGLMKEAKTGVAVISEPFWMVQMAILLEASVVSSTKIRKIIFALCRLDAWSVREQLGDSKTVMFTLPGQATAAALLPVLQETFPEDRHLFAYDGCVASVQRGVYAQRTFRRGQMNSHLPSILHGMCQDPIRLTTPLPSISPLTKDASLRSLEGALTQVPIQNAQCVETWMSSVNAYFKLKQEQDTNGYLPFVFKLGFLTSPVGNFETGTDSYWSLNSLLQFVTGSSSRALPKVMVDAAKEWLKDYNEAQQKHQMLVDKSVVISDEERKQIENCVFQHKSILIGNKTLQDTVLPREHWTLKQASRAGCSCCGPDPYEEETEESQMDSGMPSGMDMSDPGTFARVFKRDTAVSGSSVGAVSSKESPSNNYVDGKLGFAFDPSRFS